MNIADLGTQPALDSIVKDLERYGLMKHALELQAYGFTVVPPHVLGTPPDFIVRLRDAILRVCEQRNGIRITLSDSRADPSYAKNSWRLLAEDRVFVEAALNPTALALTRWLLGQSAILAGNNWIIKPPTEGILGLHSDSHGIPPGGGHIAHVANVSWICTDYSDIADGPTVFIPGSHRHGRATLPHEGKIDGSPYKVVPVIAEAGSLAVWNGATWHGSAPRSSDGLRVTLVQIWMRMHMRPMHLWQRDEFPPAWFEEFPELEKVLGLNSLYPFDRNVDHPERIGPFMHTGTDPFA